MVFIMIVVRHACRAQCLIDIVKFYNVRVAILIVAKILQSKLGSI